MTPEEQFRLLRETSAKIAKLVEDAFKRLVARIRGGQPVKDALREVMGELSAEYKATLASALSAIVGRIDDIDTYLVGELTLSSRLYSQSQVTSSIVESVIDKHTRGFQDARALALELYEGYGFKPEEILNISPTNDAIPRYMRNALLRDESTRRALDRAYARAQAKALRTGALRAAYMELLDAIDAVEGGVGADYLDKKLNVAFNEKMRYFSNRIAQTELHRAYAIEQAREIMADEAVKFVQWRLNPAHPVEDICDYFAGVDLYGLGRGVYPKALAPVAPAHPFCKCVLSKLFDIEGEPVIDGDAELSYFNKLPPDQQRKVAGSKKKLERIKAGESAWDVHNANIDPVYQVKKASSV